MRLIDADALKEELDKKAFDLANGRMIFIESINHIIDNAPTVPMPDFKEGYMQAIKDGKTNFSRPQGEWKLHGMIYYCSVCGHECGESGDNFCGNCGADMKGGAE